jgi:hypothetical protein
LLIWDGVVGAMVTARTQGPRFFVKSFVLADLEWCC